MFKLTIELLKDLTPGEKYDIRVLARTRQGWPNIDESFGWVTVSMPSLRDLIQAKILITSSKTFKLVWSAKEHLILQLTSWKIDCKNEDGDTIFSLDFPKNQTEYSLDSLGK